MTHFTAQAKLDLSDCTSYLPSNLFQGKNRFFQKKRPRIKQLLLRRNRLDSLSDYTIAFDLLKKNLCELSLRENVFETFPREILVLDNLTSLSLANNRLRHIEPGIFSKLIHLEWVNFSGNKLSDLPLDVSCCQGLKGFDLQNNEFKNLPETLYFTPQLQVLLLQKNQISHLSEEHQLPDTLHTLNLSFNQLVKVPLTLIHDPPTSLKHLYLSGNKLRQIPDDFIAKGYDQLVSLDLHTCQLSKCSKQFFLNLSRCQELKRLNLAINYLVLIPAEIGLLVHLQWLNLNDNLIVALPDTMTNLTQLIKLGLVQNQLQQLPHLMFSRMEHLQKLDVRRNRLRYLPPSILSLVPRCEVEQCLDLTAPTRVFSALYCSFKDNSTNNNSNINSSHCGGSLRTLLFFENPPLEQLDGILCDNKPVLSMESAFLTLQTEKTPEAMRKSLYHLIQSQQKHADFSIANSLFEISLRQHLNSFYINNYTTIINDGNNNTIHNGNRYHPEWLSRALPDDIVPTLVYKHSRKWIHQCDLCQSWYTTEPLQIACITPMCNGRVQVPIRYDICSIHCVLTSFIRLYQIVMDWDTQSPRSELSHLIDSTSESNLSPSSSSSASASTPLSRLIKNVRRWASSFYTPVQETEHVEVNTVRLSHLSSDVFKLEKF